jgi:hypothetical protein
MEHHLSCALLVTVTELEASVLCWSVFARFRLAMRLLNQCLLIANNDHIWTWGITKCMISLVLRPIANESLFSFHPFLVWKRRLHVAQ